MKTLCRRHVRERWTLLIFFYYVNYTDDTFCIFCITNIFVGFSNHINLVAIFQRICQFSGLVLLCERNHHCLGQQGMQRGIIIIRLRFNENLIKSSGLFSIDYLSHGWYARFGMPISCSVNLKFAKFNVNLR